MATVQQLLNKAASQVGYSRWTDPQQGTIYGRWYASRTGQAWYGANGVAYCAVFVSWCFNQIGMKPVGGFGAYCPTMLAEAKKQGKALANKKNAQPGDIVFFDWGADGVADHVGIVEKNCGSYIQTIEGNTSAGTSGSQSNGGVVARRTRAWSTVCGVVRPDYPTATAGKTAATTPQKLDVDGYAGSKTISRLQTLLGTPVDGVLSGQNIVSKKYHPNITAIRYGSGGSTAVSVLQSRLGGLTVDGYLGPLTIKKLQDKLGVGADGYAGPLTVKAWQKALNSGKAF